MKTADFEKELQAKYQGIAIVQNPNRPGLSNVKYHGEDVCPVPSDEIKEEPDPNYTYRFPNGMSPRHNSIADVYAKLEALIAFLQTEEGKELQNEQD